MNKISKAFDIMRREGYLAKQAFSCCNSCADVAIGSMTTARQKSGQKVWPGCVTYHAQAAEVLTELRKIKGSHHRPDQHATIIRSMFGKKCPQLYVTYGAVFADDGTKYGDTLAVGKAFCAVLRALGVRYEWDGDPGKKIRVNAHDAIAEWKP